MCFGRENKLVVNGNFFVANGNFPKKKQTERGSYSSKKSFLKGVSLKRTHKNRPWEKSQGLFAKLNGLRKKMIGAAGTD